MLWQKESIDGELVYANLMSSEEHKAFSDDFSRKVVQAAVNTVFSQKCSLMSRQHRSEGNNLYEKTQFEEAILLYNNAIMAAKNESEELGIAYANRSACFLKLKEYALCLGDIELAKKNKYPARLMPKLESRKVECVNLLTANGEGDFQREEPILSFKADPNIPCFANCLEENFSEKYGNHIKTKCALEISQTIIIERAFSYSDAGHHFCEYCYKKKANLIPCERCVTTMFCSEECRNVANEKFHDVLCEIEIILDFEVQNVLIKSIIAAIKMFPSVEALMDTVEMFRAVDGNKISFVDLSKREYFQFFKLHSNIDAKSAFERDRLKQIAMAVFEVLRHSKIREIFQSARTAQFLSHLVLHHMHVISCNIYMASHGISYSCEDLIGIEESTKGTHLGIGITPYSSQLNHSCAPNVCRIFINDMVVYKVIRPVKSGEQLFISYLQPFKLMKSRTERAVELDEKYHFVCECMSCKSNYLASTADGKPKLDDLTCRLLAILDGAPEKDATHLLPVTREELRMFEEAAVHFLRQNDHPSMEAKKIQFLLAQIWYLLMRR